MGIGGTYAVDLACLAALRGGGRQLQQLLITYLLSMLKAGNNIHFSRSQDFLMQSPPHGATIQQHTVNVYDNK